MPYWNIVIVGSILSRWHLDDTEKILTSPIQIGFHFLSLPLWDTQFSLIMIPIRLCDLKIKPLKGPTTRTIQNWILTHRLWKGCNVHPQGVWILSRIALYICMLFNIISSTSHQLFLGILVHLSDQQMLNYCTNIYICVTAWGEVQQKMKKKNKNTYTSPGIILNSEKLNILIFFCLGTDVKF